jgi:phosphoglycolate phosphatase-like HAD superfamily hydrolase
MIKLANIRTIIWDLDGTLLDSFGIHVDIMTQVLTKHGLPEPSFDELRHNFHGKLEESLRGLAGDVSDEKFAALLADFLKIDNEYMTDVNHHLLMDAVTLAKHAHESGMQQILVTNRAHGVDRGNASPRNLVQNSVLCEYIDTVICGDEVEKRKPDPAVLGTLLDELQPQHTLVIGDQAVDARFAHNLSARVVLVDRLDEGIAHLDSLEEPMAPDRMVIVKSLSEIILTPTTAG